MKKYILSSALGLILIIGGTLLSVNLKRHNEKEVNPRLEKPQYSWQVTEKSIVITKDSQFFGQIWLPDDTPTSSVHFFRQNENFIFFTLDQQTPGYNQGWIKVFRMNLQTKEVADLSRDDANFADVSEDGNLAAYTTYFPSYKIILVNSKDYTTKVIDVPNKSTGVFVPTPSKWKFGDVYFSSDSKKLVYAVLEYQAAATNDEIIYGATGDLRIVDLDGKILSKAGVDYVPNKEGVVRVWGWNPNGSVNYTSVDEPIDSLSPFVSTGIWQKIYGEGDPYQPKSFSATGYVGNETVNAWFSKFSDMWYENGAYLSIAEDDLKKLPLDMKRLGINEVLLDKNTSGYETFLNLLRNSTKGQPLKLNIKAFRLFSRTAVVATDKTTIINGPWKLSSGDPLDPCSSPSYLGQVQVKGWLVKNSCEKNDLDLDPYCISLAFQVSNGDLSKFPTIFDNWVSDRMIYGVSEEQAKQLQNSSKAKPATILVSKFSWYCEGYQPWVKIDRVL